MKVHKRLASSTRGLSIKVAVLLFSASLIPLSAQKTGSLSGKIELQKLKHPRPVVLEKYLGKISGKVAPLPQPTVGVWLTHPQLSAPAHPKSVTFAQEGYQFAKHLLIIPTGTTVYFPNNDQDYHNVYSLSRTKRFDLGRYRKGSTPVPSITFDKAGYLLLNCEIHEHMQAHVLIVDSPYYTSTDSAGKFSLSGIPPGSYTLHLQFDKKQAWKQAITIAPNRTTIARPVKF